ncbi:MAG: 3-deoxy-8-phosphooctulonate synthase [Bacteroidota bacterium]
MIYPLINNFLGRETGMFFLIAGPCVVENDSMPMEIARKIKSITDRLEIPFIFKASYQKANRSRTDSFTGIGNEKALQLIAQVGKDLGIPVLTDIHNESQAEMTADYVDILQIPAFLCRQTELLVAAGKTGKTVNIKKGQFASAGSMKYAVEKVMQTGNPKVMLTERGTTFGYQDLIVDFRNIPEMQVFNVPVIVDVTHSLQQPNQQSGVTGGRPDLIETIARAAIAVGSDGIFIETHPDPNKAKSDGANMLRLDLLEPLLEKLVKIRKAI